METIYLSDGNEEPHTNIIQKTLDLIKGAGQDFGEGAAAAAGAKAISQMIPESGLVLTKLMLVAGGAVRGVLSKAGGQKVVKLITEKSNSKSKDGNSSSEQNITKVTPSGSGANKGNSNSNTNSSINKENLILNSETNINTENNNIRLDNLDSDISIFISEYSISLDKY
jgi:hypothetical protein